MDRSSNKSFRAIYQTALGQQGLFTAHQAAEAGYSNASMVYQVKAGNWNRPIRGVYELADYPAQATSDLVLWSLWSRDSDDRPQGVYSHKTALSIFEISDFQPARLHMTVPLGFRRRAALPPILILHKADLKPEDVEIMDGYRVTTALRAIIDLYRDQTVHPEILREALQEGVSKGIITYPALQSAIAADLPSELIDGLGYDKTIQLFKSRFPAPGS
jgi:predicted transcriptional regulator of viral defense system